MSARRILDQIRAAKRRALDLDTEDGRALARRLRGLGERPAQERRAQLPQMLAELAAMERG